MTNINPTSLTIKPSTATLGRAAKTANTEEKQIDVLQGKDTKADNPTSSRILQSERKGRSQQAQLVSLKGKAARTDIAATTKLSHSESKASLAAQPSRLRNLKATFEKPFRAYPKIQMVSVGRKELAYLKNRYDPNFEPLFHGEAIEHKLEKFTHALEAAEKILELYEREGGSKMTKEDGAQFRKYIFQALRVKKVILADADLSLFDRNPEVGESNPSRFASLKNSYRGFKNIVLRLTSPLRTVSLGQRKVQSLREKFTALQHSPTKKGYKTQGRDLEACSGHLRFLEQDLEELRVKGKEKLPTETIQLLREDLVPLEKLIKRIKHNSV